MVTVLERLKQFRDKTWNPTTKALLVGISLFLSKLPKIPTELQSIAFAIAVLALSIIGVEALSEIQKTRDFVAREIQRRRRTRNITDDLESVSAFVRDALPEITISETIRALPGTLRHIAESQRHDFEDTLRKLKQGEFVLEARLPSYGLIRPFSAIMKSGNKGPMEAVSVPAFWNRNNIGGPQLGQFLEDLSTFVRNGGIFKRYLIVEPGWQTTDAGHAAKELLDLEERLHNEKQHNAEVGDLSLTIIYAETLRKAFPEADRGSFRKDRNFGVWLEDGHEWHITMSYAEQGTDSMPLYRKVTIGRGLSSRPEMRCTLWACRHLESTGRYRATHRDLRYTERPPRNKPPLRVDAVLRTPEGTILGSAAVVDYSCNGPQESGVSLGLGVVDRRDGHRSQRSPLSREPVSLEPHLSEWNRERRASFVNTTVLVSIDSSSPLDAIKEREYTVIWAEETEPGINDRVAWSMGLKPAVLDGQTA